MIKKQVLLQVNGDIETLRTLTPDIRITSWENIQYSAK